MTKGDIVRMVAEKAKVKKKTAEVAINAFTEVVTEALKRGEKVEIRGFGTFLVKERASRVARDLKTGKKITVPPKIVPAFKPGRDLRKAVEKVLK
jgi:DNA-binding protein HU-beta